MAEPWTSTNVGSLCPHLASSDAASADKTAESDREGQQEQRNNRDSVNKATLSSLFSGVANDGPAIIIPEGNQRSVTYGRLQKDVINLQRDLAGK